MVYGTLVHWNTNFHPGWLHGDPQGSIRYYRLELQDST